MTKKASPVSKAIKKNRKLSIVSPFPTQKSNVTDAVSQIRELAWTGQHAPAIELATRELGAPGLILETQINILDLRAESYSAQGKPDLAAKDADAMIGLAKANDAGHLAKALIRKASIQLYIGNLKEALVTSTQAVDMAKDIHPQDRSLLALSLLRLSESQKSVSNYKTAIETAKKAMALFEAENDFANAGRASYVMAPANNVLGNAKESRQAAQTALDLCSKAGDQYGIGNALNALSSTDTDIAERIQHYQLAIEAFEKAGYLERQSAVIGNLGFSYAALGLYIHARRLTARALQMSREMGVKVGMAYWLENLFDVEVKLGELESARTHLQELAQLVPDFGDPRMSAGLEINFGLLALAEKNPYHAVQHSQNAVEIITTAGLGNENVHLTYLAKAQIKNGDPAAALKSTNKATEIHRAQSFKLPDSFTSQEIWWTHAEALFANKQIKAARQALEQAHEFLLEAIANVRDEGLRRNYLNKDEANRQLLQLWVADGIKRKLPKERLFAHLAVETNVREPFKRLTDTGLRLNALHTVSAIQVFLVEEATELSGGERVMLILEKGGKRETADFFLPSGEDAQTLLASIDSLLTEVRITGTVKLVLPSGRRATDNRVHAVNRRSKIVAPLIAQNQIIGYLYADMDSLYGTFTEVDRDMLGMLANQAAVALDNVNWTQGLEQKVRERTVELNSRIDELAIINSVQSALSSQLDVNAICEFIGEQLRSLFDSQAISIVSFDIQRNIRHYHYLLEKGGRIHVPDAEIPPLSQHIIHTRTPLMINKNFRAGLAAIGVKTRTLPGTKPAKSLLRAPILTGDKVWGLIGLDNIDHESAFSDADLHLLITLASSMSVALENARLFEEIKKARIAADAASAAKSAFLANMSHELRTPLHAIIGFSRIVRRKSEGILPDKQIENLEKVLSSGEHLLGLIDSVLDIAKIEAGRMDIHPATFNISALIDQCCNIAAPLLQPGVKLEKRISEKTIFIHSDQEKVKQILLNLLSNAAKFTHVGKIIISTEKVDDLPASASSILQIHVTDSGIGIKEEAIEKIFGEFQQADTSSTREYGGTGLGLTISRNLARLLSGNLTAVSEPGKGSTFTLTLPLQDQLQKAEQ